MGLAGLFLDASGTLFRPALQSSLGLELYPDAASILLSIKQRYVAGFHLKTALITNWGPRIFSVLQDFQLESYFDTILCADGINPPKPHSHMFQRACAELELEPSTVFHVGDSLTEDALAAQKAGLEALWIDRLHGDPAFARMSYPPKEYLNKLKHAPIHSLNEVEEFLKHYFRLGI